MRRVGKILVSIKLVPRVERPYPSATLPGGGFAGAPQASPFIHRINYIYI